MKKGIIFALICWTVSTQAQTYDFGDVPTKQLEMTVYEKDSTAGAVVLFDKGDAVLAFENNGFRFSERVHTRIKILEDEGLEYGDIEIIFRSGDPEQRVRNIKAQSYTMNDNGEIIEEAVGRRDRYEEEYSENWSVIKFSIPGVRKGSVIEYSYEIVSEDPLDFPNWYFQTDIPVMWSEFNARIPEWFKFLTITRGYHGYFVNEQKTFQDRLVINYTGARGGWTQVTRGPSGSATISYKGTDYTYVMKDVPAIKDEPFMKATNDYLAHLRFRLAAIEFPNQLPQAYLESWPEIVDELDSHRDFGRRLESNSTLNKAAAEAAEGASTALEKMIQIYEHVQQKTEWDEEYRLLVEKNLEGVYIDGEGSSSAINLLLIQMLREQGFESYPVITSTRNNGEIIPMFPLLNQFNHTIAYVAVDSVYHLLDATNDLLPYNVLPISVINNQGLMIYKNQLIWLPINNAVKSSAFHSVNIDIREDGFSGNISAGYFGLEAYKMRKQLEKENMEEILNSSSEVVGDFKYDSVEITENDLKGALKFRADVEGSFSESPGIIYFNPMIVDQSEMHPFTLEERTYPVDYEFPFDVNLVMNISIPEGWVVDELPKPVLYRLPGRAGEFRRIIQGDENGIAMNFRLQINKYRFLPEEYEILKGMYDQMVEVFSDNIVLKKES